ncbi:breast carcinoma-amplified sequence 1 isoform X2 [Betta splendens]|uniref:Breast carcinoma-amplified sequence 1 isoform X2 n=1 Tax=Betta splendens TaxID=158456 RepID=A0A9W2XWW1_BETSP|nr:breast carcinoma-amplified sequence 1 isoform X2 [Betta splendens]
MGIEQSKSEELNKDGSVPEVHENGSVNGITASITPNGLKADVKSEVTVQQNGKPLSLSLSTESSGPDGVVVQTNTEPVEAQVVTEIPETVNLKEEIKKEKVKAFGNIFKKKAAGAKNLQKQAASDEELTNVVDPQFEAGQQQQPESSSTEPLSASAAAEEADNGSSQPQEEQEQSDPAEISVMNFFKTLVAPTKTSKKETATPDASKDQVAQVSEPPAAPKGMSIPPPPPPEPPKMEIKGELAAKSAKPAPKEEPKAAAKEPASSKAKSAKNSFSKLFRPKSENKVEPQEIAKEVEQSVEQVVDGLQQLVVEAERLDPSKTSTLEAVAKPEPPPPAQEEKKPASKSPFDLFKPKTGPKKAASAPTAAAEAAQPAKAKEEPKTVAKSSEAVVENKQPAAVVQAGDTGASVPKKLEKRNSIQLFFKNLGQKRNSIDAGVQTEPVVVAPAAEKAK